MRRISFEPDDRINQLNKRTGGSSGISSGSGMELVGLRGSKGGWAFMGARSE